MGGVLRYTRSMRLTKDAEYRAVFAYKVRKGRGALTVFVAPRAQGGHRLGLSVGKRVGGAVVRNRVKRMIREAFRHEVSGFPVRTGGAGYDIVVSARTHEGRGLTQWREDLRSAVEAAARVVERREGVGGGG